MTNRNPSVSRTSRLIDSNAFVKETRFLSSTATSPTTSNRSLRIVLSLAIITPIRVDVALWVIIHCPHDVYGLMADTHNRSWIRITFYDEQSLDPRCSILYVEFLGNGATAEQLAKTSGH